MTGEQARRARELLGLTRYRLSQRCGIPEYAIHTFELTNGMTCGINPAITSGHRQARLQAMLEAAGVEFIEGDARVGVRLRGAEAS